ncbi:MAG: hypothetical protein KA354_01885 [Phycisphaerae bacterium]|nr:hypothetical protein [Phycisphaerae bacterium]
MDPIHFESTVRLARWRGRPLLSAAVCCLWLSVTVVAQEPVVHPAENADPTPGPAGQPPYEMAGRVEERPPLVAFDDLAGWEVEGRNAEGWLYRSSEQRIYQREHVAKLVYVAKGEKPMVTVRPRKPITVPDPWDTFTFWTYGACWGWAPDPKTPPVGLEVLFRDADGKEFSIWPGTIDHQYWFMMCARLNADQKAKLKRPFALAGLRFHNGANTEKRAIYLGPCYAYPEELGLLTFEPWPDKLPFPTRPETILPTNKVSDFRNAVRREGKTTIFSYEASDGRLEYRYTPTDGTLGDLELRFRDRVIHPCAGGGAVLASTGGGAPATSPAVQRALTEEKLADGRLQVSWRLVWGEVVTDLVYELYIQQKSLIVEIRGSEPVVERVALGRADPLSAPKLFKIPYLTFGWGNTDPRVLYSDGLFLFTQFDWYVSDASKLWGAAEAGPTWARFNGGAEYVRKTDGARNRVRERLFINASPDVQEVLPTIPNPQSPFKNVQGERLWRVKDGSNHKAEITEATLLRKLGCEKVSIRYHENTWRDAGESFTFRLHAAPGQGGDEGCRAFVAAIKALGWRVGLYTNYIDFAPVNSHWNEDHVIRQPNGDWQRAWMRCYSAKPMYGVQMEALLAPQIHAKFGTNHSYCDVHTVFMPCEREDYDARVPGAATFRRTYECYGRLLYNEKMAHDGPVYSEGRNHWLYAGLTDGNYAQLASDSPPDEPLLPDFDLLKIHPLEMDAGMGDPGMFFKGKPYNLDQYIATTLAYGHIGFFDWPTLEGRLKIYYLLQPVQEFYAMEPVKAIEYEKGGRMVASSEALASGAYLNNRLLVQYGGGRVCVNGSTKSWIIDRSRGLELPSWGFLARGDCGAVSESVITAVAGREERDSPRRRLDLSYLIPEGPDPASTGGHCYADTRGVFFFLPIDAALQGSAAFKKDGDTWYLIPTTQFVDAAFAPRLVDKASNVAVVALNLDDSPAEAPEIRWSRGLLHVIPKGQCAFRYRLVPTDREPPRMADCPTRLACGGATLQATLPEGIAPNAEQVTWEVAGSTRPAGAGIDRGTLTCQVPEGFKEGEHVWLRIPVGEQVLWLDFIAVAAKR